MMGSSDRWCVGGRGGFTLVELMVSLAVVSLVLAALTAASGFVARAVPAANDAGLAARDAEAFLERLREDVAFADGVMSLEETGFELIRDDGSASGGSQEVMYTWTSKGGPIARTVEGETVSASPGASSCVFSYVREERANQELLRAPSEQLLLYGETRLFDVALRNSSSAWSQPLEFGFDGSVRSWALDSVRILMAEASASLELRIALYESAGGGVPSGDAIVEVVLDEGDLDEDLGVVVARFEETAALDAALDYVLVVEGLKGSFEVLFHLQAGSGSPALMASGGMSGPWGAYAFAMTVEVTGRVSSLPPVYEVLRGVVLEADFAGVGVVRTGVAPRSAVEVRP